MKRHLLCLLTSLISLCVSAQTTTLLTIRTKADSLIMYLGNERGNFNGINKIPKSFSYDFITEHPATPLALVSEQDSIQLTLRHGLTTAFRIIREAKGDTVNCTFTSHKPVKAATFTDAYKKANTGKTIIEIPEVYELINVVFALTDYGKTPAIEKDSSYYPAMMAYFTPYRDHPAVRTFDTLLSKSEAQYFPLKMDSYAYRFDGDKIVKGEVYDRTGWGETNSLIPYIALLESFAKQAKFRAFYRQQQPYYNRLLTDYRQNIDVATMKRWLENQFPATRYSAVKVIFSPLVGWNQSAKHFSDNGFTEAHAHVNYPFVSASDRKQPPALTRGQRMMIVFTELNHSYLNPEAEKHLPKVDSAYGDLAKWVTPQTPSTNYNNPLSCFEEYMNYGLVTLLYNDLFDRETFETLRTSMEKNMTTRRGFRQFDAFNQELLRLYRQRKPGQTVADLYPAILDWAVRY